MRNKFFLIKLIAPGYFCKNLNQDIAWKIRNFIYCSNFMTNMSAHDRWHYFMYYNCFKILMYYIAAPLHFFVYNL